MRWSKMEPTKMMRLRMFTMLAEIRVGGCNVSPGYNFSPYLTKSCLYQARNPGRYSVTFLIRNEN